jgi:hypothetical protein
VVATGNHYFFDIAAGVAVTALGYALSGFISATRPDAGGACKGGDMSWSRTLFVVRYVFPACLRLPASWRSLSSRAARLWTARSASSAPDSLRPRPHSA